MEWAQEKDFSAALAPAYFAKNLKLLPNCPALSAGRKNPLSMDYATLRQCKLGELRRVATVSRPDICARLARIAPRNELWGSDVYRMNVLFRVAQEWRRTTVLRYASASHPLETLGRSVMAERVCVSGEEGYIAVRCLWRDGRMPLFGPVD